MKILKGNNIDTTPTRPQSRHEAYPGERVPPQPRRTQHSARAIQSNSSCSFWVPTAGSSKGGEGVVSPKRTLRLAMKSIYTGVRAADSDPAMTHMSVLLLALLMMLLALLMTLLLLRPAFGVAVRGRTVPRAPLPHASDRAVAPTAPPCRRRLLPLRVALHRSPAVCLDVRWLFAVGTATTHLARITG